jgi:hypothetical protein
MGGVNVEVEEPNYYFLKSHQKILKILFGLHCFKPDLELENKPINQQLTNQTTKQT